MCNQNGIIGVSVYLYISITVSLNSEFNIEKCVNAKKRIEIEINVMCYMSKIYTVKILNRYA